MSLVTDCNECRLLASEQTEAARGVLREARSGAVHEKDRATTAAATHL